MAFAGDARADAAGGEPLSRARQAWDKGEFDGAEPLYKEALDKGGLSPKETLECWVHMGAARVVMGRKKDAMLAFRVAALIEPRFAMPPEAGKKATTIANQARKEAAKLGALQLRAEVPESAAGGKPFRVSASLDAAHASLVTKLGVFVAEPAFERTEPAATSVGFDIPGTVSTPNSTIVVRFDALDGHDNRLVSIEKRVRVGAGVPETPVAMATRPDDGKTDPNAWAKPIPDNDDKNAQKKGGFWSSPWPYLIGGVALAAGGAAVYLGTRPSDDVTVGAATVRVR